MLLFGLRGDYRAHLGLGVRGRPDLHHADLGRERLDQPVGGLVADRHRHRNRHAALSGGAEARAHQRIDRLIHVGVRHDDHVVLGAA